MSNLDDGEDKATMAILEGEEAWVGKSRSRTLLHQEWQS